jgi:hypothetical protein
MPESRDVAKEGVGLINTRERLKYLYGEAHTFNLSSFPGRGVTIRIVIPFKEREPRLARRLRETRRTLHQTAGRRGSFPSLAGFEGRTIG